LIYDKTGLCEPLSQVYGGPLIRKITTVRLPAPRADEVSAESNAVL